MRIHIEQTLVELSDIKKAHSFGIVSERARKRLFNGNPPDQKLEF